MTIALTVIFAIILVMGFLNAPKDGSGRRPALSCHSVILSLFAVYMLLPAILIIANGGNYTWAPFFASEDSTSASLLLGMASLLSFLYANAIGRKMSVLRPAKTIAGISSAMQGRNIAILLVIAGMLIKVYFIMSSGGLDQTIQRLSGSIRDSSGLGELGESAIGLRTFSGLADGAAVWLFLNEIKNKKRVLGPSIILAIVLATTYLTMGKRLGLLWPLLAIAVGIHVYRRYMPLKTLPLGAVGFLALTMGALFFRIFAPAASAGVGVDLNQISYAGGSALAFYFYSLEFSTLEMISVVMARQEEMIEMLGGGLEAFIATNLTPFTYIIPRAVWPEKPEMFYDASYAVSATLLGQNIDGSTAGFASTIIGTGYLTGGLIGSIGALAALGIFAAKADQLLTARDWTVGRVLLYAFTLVVSFHLFRQGSAAWTFIISVVQQLGFIAGIAIPLIIARLPQRAPSHTRSSLKEPRQTERISK